MATHTAKINRAHVAELNAFIRLRNGHGDYPGMAVTDDGAMLCRACCTSELELVYRSTRDGLRDGWQVVGIQTLWEGPDVYCDHCNKPTETAYGDPDAVVETA